MKILKVHGAIASAIIETRKPEGYGFYCVEKTKKGNTYVGIDNMNGDAWTEVFPTLKLCKDWLNGKFEMSDYSEKKKQYKTHEPRITFDYY